jgi:hypothetical protein
VPETATVTIQHIDLEPDMTLPGQNIYNFAVILRGVTNDPQATAETKWNPIALCRVTRTMPVDPLNPVPWFYPNITFAQAPISLNARSDGTFKLKLDSSLSKHELFELHFEPNAGLVQLQMERLTLRPTHRDVEVTRQVQVYVKNSNSVESDVVTAQG